MAKEESITLPLLFCVVLVGFVAYYAYTVAAGERAFDDPIEVILAAIAAAVSLLCITLLFQIKRMYQRLKVALRNRMVPDTESQILELTTRNTEHVRKLKALANQVEILSAMREISLLASQDVDFERLVEHALALVEQLIGTREISLFLRSRDDRDVLKVRAHRADGKTLFGEQINADEIDWTHVSEVARYANIKRRETDESLDLTVPVMADREVLGAAKVKIDKEPHTPEDLSQAQNNLRNIIHHIGLAIKTPALYERAVHDSLTGLYTKRHMTDEMARLFAGCKRLSKSLALIMFDLDRFKKINDTHGHLTGDIVLREVTAIIKEHIRDYDSAYRYGGEELLILLPDTDARSAVAVAKRIRERVEKKRVMGDRNQKVKVTVSAGVAIYRPYMDTPQDLIAEADKALYAAKQSGRNQVKFSQQRKKTQ